MGELTKIISSASGYKVREQGERLSKAFDGKSCRNLDKIGIHFGVSKYEADENLREMAKRVARLKSSYPNFAMDNLQPPVTIPTAGVPVQFLQYMTPGLVHVLTNARRGDEVTGVQVMGSWEDEQIVFGIIEALGIATPYTDYENTKFSSYNNNFIYRSVVNFSLGIRVGMKEEARAARINIDSAAEKRGSAALQLEIQRNAINFYGFNGGNNYTYGILNDPSLPAYEVVPEGVSLSTQWQYKTLLEIIADIQFAISQLRTQSGDQIDPERLNLRLVLPTSVVDYLSKIADFGYSVRKWIKDSYASISIVSCPEFDLANGGENVGYLFAERVEDASTDGKLVWNQGIQTKFLVLGVAKYENYYTESYLMSTSGATLKRPIALTRFTGI